MSTMRRSMRSIRHDLRLEAFGLLDRPEVNVPLLRHALTWAWAEHVQPKEVRRWRQTDWVSSTLDGCGTAHCFAGYIVSITVGVDSARRGFANDGQRIPDAARQALGLTQVEARYLFYEDNTLDDLKEIVDRIMRRAGVPA